MAWFWLIVRLYLGYEWFTAGWEKLNPMWTGGNAGGALTSFVNGALAKTVGAHADVSSWYAWFLQHIVANHVVIWSNAIAFGEILVGIGLIFGAFTFLAAFFGFFMNLNYLLSGTVSMNPQLLVLALLIMLASRVAGTIGLDPVIRKKFHLQY